MLHTLILLAADEGTTPAPKGQAPDMLMTFLPIMLIMLAFYLIVLRPQQKRQEREKQQMLTNLKKNDRVQTIGGILGTVVSVSDKEDEVVIKVDDNARIRFLKSAIARNFTNEETAEAEKKQQETKDK